jgi:hypothetical protein
MTAAHFIFIPAVLLIGIIIGWMASSSAGSSAPAPPPTPTPPN